MADAPPRNNRPLLLKLGLAAVVVAAGGLLVLRGVDVRGLIQQGLDVLRAAGPVAFFGAMAVLPAFGAPLSPFALTAGSAFGPSLGLPVVILCSLTAVTLNIAASYLLARRALRPVLERIVARLGYKLPEVESGDAADLIILLRVTPGVPFPVQNYLLGLARVPFGKYLLLSCTLQGAVNAAIVVFGEALLSGKGKVALIGLSVLVALAAGLHLLRRHVGRGKAA